MAKGNSIKISSQGKLGNRLSFYPLKFDEVISDVLKVKPEPKPPKTKKKQKHNS